MYQIIKAVSNANTLAKKSTETMDRGKRVTDSPENYSRAGFGGIVVTSALLGIWGLTCLISGFSGSGEQDLVRGLLTAIIGY